MSDQVQSEEKVEISSYKVTATRAFEVDFSDGQVAELMQQTGESDPEAAISAALEAQELNKISPEQKLLGVDVSVNGD